MRAYYAAASADRLFAAISVRLGLAPPFPIDSSPIQLNGRRSHGAAAAAAMVRLKTRYLSCRLNGSNGGPPPSKAAILKAIRVRIVYALVYHTCVGLVGDGGGL